MKFLVTFILSFFFIAGYSQCDTATYTTVSQITNTYARVDWVKASGAVSYTIFYTTGGTTLSVTIPQGAINNIFLNTTISGLTPCSAYTLYIRTNCSGSNNSQIGRKAFTTVCANASASNKYTDYRAYGWEIDRFRAKKVLSLPTVDTVHNTTYADSSQIVLNPTDSTLYYRYKGYWRPIGTGTGGGDNISNADLTWSGTTNQNINGDSLKFYGGSLAFTTGSLTNYNSGNYDAATVIDAFSDSFRIGNRLDVNNFSVINMKRGSNSTFDLTTGSDAGTTGITLQGERIWIRTDVTGLGSGHLQIDSLPTGLTASRKALTIDTLTGYVSTQTLTSYTDAQARAALSVTGSGGSYDSTTGVITLSGGSTPTLQQVLTAGSTLTQNNTILGGGYDLLVSNSRGSYGYGMKVQNLGSGNGMFVNGTSIGIFSQGGDFGIAAYSPNSIGIQASTDEGTPIQALNNTTATNTIVPMLQIIRQTGAGAAGLGSSIDFQHSASNGAPTLSHRLISTLTTATAFNVTSKLEVWGIDSGTLAKTLGIPSIINNYANNAAAISAGLSVGDIYRNGDALNIVH